MTTTTTTSQPTLERRLGPLDAAAIIIANVIGGGILFRSPPVAIASNVPDAAWFLATWLARRRARVLRRHGLRGTRGAAPQAGGEYVYLREAFGPLAGFLTGWTSFVAGFAGAMAAGDLLPLITLNASFPGSPTHAAARDSDPLTASAVTFSVHTLATIAVITVWPSPDSHSRRRPRPPGQQRADDAEDRVAADVHRARIDDG